jgi:hypothetical protein
MANRELEKYEFLQRLDVTCDLFAGMCSHGWFTPKELFANIDTLFDDIVKEHGHDRQYLQSVVDNVHPELAEALLKPKHDMDVVRFGKALKGYTTALNDHLAAGKPVVYSFPTLTSEIWYAMDIIPLHFELLSGLLSGVYITGVEAEADAAAKEGFGDHICGFTKGPIKSIEMGLLPKPDILCKNGSPCDASNLNYVYAADLHNCPLLVLDSPYYSDDRALEYYTENIKEMIVQVEKITGHKIDEDKLRYHVDISNRQLKYYYALQDLRKETPCPDPGTLRFLDFGSLAICGHSEKVIDYCKGRYDRVKARVDKGETFLPAGKKEIRTLWTWGWIANMFYLPDWLEEEFASTYMECQLSYMPGDVVGYVDTTNLDTMIDGLAWRSLNFCMHKTAMSYSDIWVNDFLTVAQSYKADVALFGGNRACKHAWSLSKILSDVLLEKCDIPSFIWEHDVCDKRYTSHKATKAMLTEFFNSIA